MSHIGIVGAGWAGLAAAVLAVERGHTVSLWEASRHLGGRARSQAERFDDDAHWQPDNGQHLLISAYTQTRELMAKVGVRPEDVCLDTHLDLRMPDGRGLALPKTLHRWPAVLQLGWALMSAQGWHWRDRLALARWSLHWKHAQAPQSSSVADICADLPEPVQRELITPLCVSALNLPPHLADANGLLQVLRDSLWASPRRWRAWIPRVPLGQLFPEPAARWLRERGAQLHLGERVQRLQLTADGVRINGHTNVDKLVLATPAPAAAALAAQLPHAQAQDWADTAQALEHTAIATAYARASGLRLPRPMMALPVHHARDAQFVFDLGQLGRPEGLFAAVLSHAPSDARGLKTHLTQQLRQTLGDPTLQILQLVLEKRACFAATPGLRRPSNKVCPKVWACGDHVDGPYPATLEGAVRSAHQLPWEELT